MSTTATIAIAPVHHCYYCFQWRKPWLLSTTAITPFSEGSHIAHAYHCYLWRNLLFLSSATATTAIAPAYHCYMHHCFQWRKPQFLSTTATAVLVKCAIAAVYHCYQWKSSCLPLLSLLSVKKTMTQGCFTFSEESHIMVINCCGRDWKLRSNCPSMLLSLSKIMVKCFQFRLSLWITLKHFFFFGGGGGF